MSPWPMLVVLLVLGWMNQQSSCSRERGKRVINGEPFNGRPTVYHVIRYFGALGSVHGTPWYVLGFWDELKEKGLYGEVSCGGSLLAPMIFQTACHCVATFDYLSRSLVSPAVVEHNWEAKKVVYVGVSNQYGPESMTTYSPIQTERFVVHSKCGALASTGLKIGTYDYAVIRLEAKWVVGDSRYKYPWIEIAWAPQYSAQDIADFHQYALEKQLVCMHIGFGTFRDGSDVVSDVLRHGWAILVPQFICTIITIRLKWGLLSDSEVNRLMNWVCTALFPKHDQDTGLGDSGSPLTCDNRYYGLLSGGIGGAVIEELSARYGAQYEHISLFHTLLHNPYVNAIEYRYDLIHQLYLNASSYDNERRNLRIH